ncbi:asparagine synthase (glutamine-hydrolyzing) [bacterium]|jgi:asparagine synthase (glutamine-hydrolysing)|nr:asparagine synthase (glutamine-hydrolyzing) [bacterium]
MCGIAGISGRSVKNEDLVAACNSISHRGPNDSGIWASKDVSLLHTRLSILDLSYSGHQPMVDEKSGVVLVYNGEIYNYKELKKRMSDIHFKGSSDSEVLLKMYLKYGISSVELLRGMFAFSIWDPRSQTLHLARDRFGIKPLYYNFDGSSLIFGSEVKAISALGYKKQLNMGAVYDYLQHGKLEHNNQSLFEGIESLPAAHILSFNQKKIKVSRYWSLSSDNIDESIKNPEEEVWEKLKEVVKLHMVSDVPVGVSLSSGLDSQLITHILDQIGYDNYHTFTYGFNEKKYDEVARLGLINSERQHFSILNSRDLITSLEQAMTVFESPLGGVGTISAWAMMSIPAKYNVPVLLSGEGSDELFAGYRYYYYAWFRELYLSENHAQLAYELEAFNSLYKTKLKLGSEEFLKEVVHYKSIQRAPDGTNMSGNGFLGKKIIESRFDEHKVDSNTTLRQAMISDITSLKLPKLLMFQDKASMAWGVESRVPFLDHELMELVYRLETKWMIRDGISKYLPKMILSKFCGVKYQETIKHFVSTPQREWLKKDAFDSIQKYLSNGILIDSGMIDFKSFMQEYDRYSSSKELGNSFFIWKILNLEAFMQKCF